MKVIVLGAGIIGVSTAWHLLERGHEVTLVDRQVDAALETSYANAGQISVSYCEPWAAPGAPLQVLKWMAQPEAPLLFRPALDRHQWRWGLQFLANCNQRALERNLAQLLALGTYSQQALHEVVAATGIDYQRLTRGIAHFFCDAKSLDAAARTSERMRAHGIERQVLDREGLLAVEPALRSFAHRIVGGTYTATDESGDARTFTQALARRCAERGARMLFGRAIQRIDVEGGAVRAVWLGAGSSEASASNDMRVTGDAIVAACGSHTAPLLRPLGVNLPIYPGKGYSASFRILRPDAAPWVSTIDDDMHCAFTRLGDVLRVAGTIELNGFDPALDTPRARARCRMLARRVEEVLPGVCDTREAEDGGDPHYWTGLRPLTPGSVPWIGRTRVPGLWVNAGHGTLGWTHGAGSGKALAALISGEPQPVASFAFHGAAA